MKRSEAIGRLFDYAVEHPDGFTYRDVQGDLGWDRSYFTKIHRSLRLLLGNDDQINLVCTPRGQREPWTYKLVGNFDQSRDWATNRVNDAETRLTTIAAILGSVRKALDGRSRDARRARIMELAIRHAKENLAELDHGEPLF